MTVDSTPGVVLKGFDIGESDVVVELYTVRWGRVHAVAKGGRRSKRRFVNKLEPFSYLRLLLAGRERGLMRLQEADIIRPFFHLTEDLRRILYAFHALELVRVMTPLWDPHPEVMGLLVRFLSFVDEEVSIGDYVLAGGEVAAAAIVEATSRMIPGVVGKYDSVESDSFFGRHRLGPPQYTRPPVFRGLSVPDVLLTGDHERIAAFREAEAWKKTAKNRPDLLGLKESDG